MSRGLTSTKHFGFTASWLRAGIAYVADTEIASFSGDPALATELGLGVIQLQALGAWMRFAGLVQTVASTMRLTGPGRLLHAKDPLLSDRSSWWLIHYQLGVGYTAWQALARAPYGAVAADELDGLLTLLAPDMSQTTIRNARTSVIRALEDTPIGNELGLFRLEGDGKRTTGLTKLPVRHGQAPMAAVGYAILDWARREGLSSVGLTSLAAPDGPGPILHMSEGALERYLIEIDGAYRGRVLTYSRTANLNEAYFRAEVTPLQVLASHYLHEQEGLDWPEALDRATEEVPGTDDD